MKGCHIPNSSWNMADYLLHAGEIFNSKSQNWYFNDYRSVYKQRFGKEMLELAKAFAKQHPLLIFRAIFECWSVERIFRETFPDQPIPKIFCIKKY